ncbi:MULTISPECIES: type II toxin-antitoxin system VapC family toxin [unclassified Sphingopyxis]|uniref:type II toxin-antitoxin system VapC family toxin n=1 Tax=unclassified Sphingopyxis TaxID=2614943 RepID=UPI000868E478|nr:MULTISPECIES: type II toxin-antitoxin system VapC family toxin [unclassified Sphingopyxis]ODU24594.1 MAG: twitching motility protein PilT [Sphingopyxis sp. SCN 67-31]PAL19290.1 VapC toxin family PIN domain ribonuclease [Sphingopyxis sp. GW247-27LB]
MTDYVLDASAVLAVIQEEPGAERIEAHLDTGCISAVNLAEIVGKLQDRGLGDNEIDELIALLDLDTRILDKEGAVFMGKLRQSTKVAGLSLGDRACLALAHSLGATAITMDRAWKDLEIGVAIEVAR